MRFSEIIGEINDPIATAREVQRRRDREAKARREMAAASGMKADASRRYQSDVRSADQQLDNTRRGADAATAKKRAASSRYQQTLSKANDRIVRAQRSFQ